eukprot:4068463-Amphidinium_carterae.1
MKLRTWLNNQCKAKKVNQERAEEVKQLYLSLSDKDKASFFIHQMARVIPSRTCISVQVDHHSGRNI